MQHITEVLKVLKTKFSDAYVLASSGDVVVETADRKRGSRASATILCEAEARAQAREITGDITEEERGALAGLVLFFDFQRRLGEALDEEAFLTAVEADEAQREAAFEAEYQALLAEERAQAEAEEAVIEEEAEAIRAEEEGAVIEAALTAGLIVPAVDEDTLLNPSVAQGQEGALLSLKPLSFGALNHFEGQGVTTIPGLIERLSNGNDDPPLWVCHACQALFTYSGGDEAWLERASAAREKVMANEEEYRKSKEALLDPGQFHGADGAEKAHIEAKAAMTRKLNPVARFVAEGVKYARQLDKGTAAEVSALKADIIAKWGEVGARAIAPTLKVSWA